MVKTILIYLLFSCSIPVLALETKQLNDSIHVEFIGNEYSFEVKQKISLFKGEFNKENLIQYATQLSLSDLNEISNSLIQIRNVKNFDDWIFYQLIRKTSQELIKKKDDYIGYTLCKWYLLKQAKFEPLLSLSKDKLLIYIKCEDNVYNQPLKTINNQQYICLNYHDYNYEIDFNNEKFTNLYNLISEANNFSFKINDLPSSNKIIYSNKVLNYSYKNRNDFITVKIDPQIGLIFRNYPVVDYESQFNIPLSKETYESLIPALKEKTKNLSITKGVEYLMYFTRHAFLYERDTEIFGREKRFSPEETLLNEKSDCEDRSALFFLLVKELYNLPMIVVSYPEHITVAVKLDRAVRHQIIYKGESFTICEPTPQKRDFRIGEQANQMIRKPYEIEFAYHPFNK